VVLRISPEHTKESTALRSANAIDVGLFEILGTEKVWTVRRIAQTLAAPMTTVSSALDRLERQGPVQRRRTDRDRRVVRIEFTGRGRYLATRLLNAHVKNCRDMLSKLNVDDRSEFLRMAAQISGRVPPPNGQKPERPERA